ncbi:hypothetical protein XENOCAPTIV_028542 [Xenoophorus captivus]|uniref:Uncharacterized protein n=1 Tax=Xenoophorus captivus TaxID=1517983 RepID=A0ABV0RCZ0_9TELE
MNGLRRIRPYEVAFFPPCETTRISSKIVSKRDVITSRLASVSRTSLSSPSASHFDPYRLLGDCQRANLSRFYPCSIYASVWKVLTVSELELGPVTVSILQRAEHAALASRRTTPCSVFVGGPTPPLRKYHVVFQYDQCGQLQSAHSLTFGFIYSQNILKDLGGTNI